MKILAISGSLRAESSNTALLHAAAALAPEGVHITIYDGLKGLPYFDPGLEPEEAPGPVMDFRAGLKAADAVLICTPEYAHGMPGILKNALEWTVASGEFVAKPVAALSASPSSGGGEKARAWLVQTLAVMSAEIVPEASLSLPFVRTKLKAHQEGRDPALAETLRAVLEALARAVEARQKWEAIQ